MNDIFEELPDNLALTRNSNAPEFDRWRIYNKRTQKSLEETGAASAEECMEKLVKFIESERHKWLSQGE